MTTVGYLGYALLALVAYTFVPPLIRVATASLSSDVIALTTNGFLVLAALGLVVSADGEAAIREALLGPKAPYVWAAGICLAVGILAYYRALKLGPVSVVTPIFALFLVSSSIIGVLFLEESLTVRRGLGVGFAVLAVYFTTTSA